MSRDYDAGDMADAVGAIILFVMIFGSLIGTALWALEESGILSWLVHNI